ncbi:hypothetical protein [Saccharopolyspora elongata]|uniref:Uncharacterized protein n=1 Tax=Saccharopolyspora elongata TaxID=2530387 RepID=A0A4R4YRT0_9PSEU|nr:hypothetical protein [Saccharopolyspora elongata]TDD47941.1 hypothetical protein E1288_23615 [Saccharopolyspora elongata]
MFRRRAAGFGVALVAFGAAVFMAGPASASPATEAVAHKAVAQASYDVVAMWPGTGDDQVRNCELYRVTFFPNGECMFYDGNTELRVPK